DLEAFGESLLWQAEDIRQARGLPEEEEIIDDKDFRYFEHRYQQLRQEHAQLVASPNLTTRFQVMRMLDTLNDLGFSLLDMSGHAFQQFTTVLPHWYVQRIQKL